MLVLSRKKDEQIFIGDSIVVTVLKVGPSSVRIGIDAPPEFNIKRSELPVIAGHLGPCDEGGEL